MGAGGSVANRPQAEYKAEGEKGLKCPEMYLLQRRTLEAQV